MGKRLSTLEAAEKRVAELRERELAKAYKAYAAAHAAVTKKIARIEAIEAQLEELREQRAAAEETIESLGGNLGLLPDAIRHAASSDADTTDDEDEDETED